MTRNWNNPAGGRTGFTLVELAMVMLILGVLVAIGAPRYASSANSYHVNMAARKIAADLAMARSDAWNRGAHRTVAFTTANLQYQLTGVADMNNSAQANMVVRLGGDPYRVTQMSANFGGVTSVIFDGYGMPNSGGQVSVTSGSLTQTVTLNGTTGNITIP